MYETLLLYSILSCEYCEINYRNCRKSTRIPVDKTVDNVDNLHNLKYNLIFYVKFEDNRTKIISNLGSQLVL